MRVIFIAAVLLATLLTFYSALWYKSETIEQDITKRVTEDLNTANAKDVGIDVDGRHVTLSGVVYDAETEQSYLDTADQTYGALGPIDGLTYVAGTGFVKAVKTAEGITLKGTVASEEARTAMVEAATAATDGAVDDQLTIGAAAGDWEGEASYGLAQMGALSTGALAVTPGSYSLSGTADMDDTGVKAAFADRDGWQTFTSAPAVGEGLNARIASLESTVAERNQSIADLTAERDTLASENGALSGQRKALAGSLAALKLERDSFAGERDAITVERDAALGERDAITAERDAALGERDAITAERDAALGERDMKQQELDNLRASLDSNQSDVAALSAARDAAEATVAERDATIEGLNGQISDLTAQNAQLSDDLATQTAALSGDQTALQEQLNAQNAKVDTLMADLGARDTKIAELENGVEMATTKATQAGAELDTLQASLADRDGTITDLQGKLSDREAEVAKLNDQLATASAAVPQDDAKIAALTAAVAAQKAEAMTLGKQVEDLTGVVAERDATIASLQNAPATGQTSAQMAAQCSERASGVLENARINFRTATANIDAGSVEALERLTGIALACVGDGLTVEIGGHTDAQGSDENNQALSERRAQAILAFMAERGVPTAGLKAVGYGEAKPIADNATAEGRAQNRRISFDWQAR